MIPGGEAMYHTANYNSPLGPLLLYSRDGSLTGLWMQPHNFPPAECTGKQDDPVLMAARQWLDRYFRGEQPNPAALPLAPEGTPFQKQVWALLLEIPYGESISYGALAKKLSPSMSAQAIGGAVGRNPISIIIPCHRVLGSHGQLTGYAGGLQNKRFLLEHEGISYKER